MSSDSHMNILKKISYGAIHHGQRGIGGEQRMRICEECEQTGMCILRDEVGNVQIIPALQAYREQAIHDIDDAIEHLLKLLPRADQKAADGLIRLIQQLMHANAWLIGLKIGDVEVRRR